MKSIIYFRLIGFEPDCPDSCAYTKDGGPPDEIWCFKTSTHLTLYPATNLCPNTQYSTFVKDTSPVATSPLITTTHSTLQMDSTLTPRVVSTTAKVDVEITKTVRFN